MKPQKVYRRTPEGQTYVFVKASAIWVLIANMCWLELDLYRIVYIMLIQSGLYYWYLHVKILMYTIQHHNLSQLGSLRV